MSDSPPDLSGMLLQAREAGKIRMINIYFNVDGSCSVTTQDHQNSLMRTGHNSSPGAALADALGGKGRPSMTGMPKEKAPASKPAAVDWDDLI